ncbi:hypothetical protein YK56LOC_69380 [Caballeronia sp. HLA56]
MYARGMSVREIQAFLAEAYGTEVSPDFISSVTDEVMAEALAWQSRPLEPMYPVVFFDALRVKIRGDGVVSNKAVYLALGIQADGQRDVLGLWIEQTEGAKFWLKVFNELKTRGCQDILIAVVDGLKGLAEAIGTAYTTNAIESLNMQLRKIIKTRGHFPNDEAAIKLLWLALRNVLAKSVRAAFDWSSAMNQFAILFGERFTNARG